MKPAGRNIVREARQLTASVSSILPTRRALRLTGLATALAILAIGHAHACRCRELPLYDYLAAADRVAEARIVAVSDASLDDQLEVRRYRIDIVRRFKGRPFTEIHSYISTATCGVDFAPGERIWVFADEDSGSKTASADSLWMNTCNGTRPASAGFVDVEAGEVAEALAAVSAK